MRLINYKHSIAVPVDQAFDWFVYLEKNYILWHPETHKNFQWLSDKPVMKGSVFKFEEKIEGHSHKMVMEISDFIKNQRITFSLKIIYAELKYLPDWLTALLIRIFKINMEMFRDFERVTSNSTTIHTVHKFGSSTPVIGKIIDWYIEHQVFSKGNHIKHIEEEAINMENALVQR